MKQLLILIMLAIVMPACRESPPVMRVDELQALVGRPVSKLETVLGKPPVGEKEELHFYHVMVRSEVDAKPRQRTVVVSVESDTIRSVRID